MKPRLKHVADVAGVSQATVSRVLNGKPGVAETTRREVLHALSQLGYEPVGVRGSRRTGLVGLIVPELDNPVFPRFAQAIESRLAAKGLTTVLCTSTPSGMGEGDYLDVLLAHEVIGIVIVSGLHADVQADHHRYQELIDRGVPTVVVNGRPPTLGLPAITVDHVAAAQQGVAHLASLGHERIGLTTGPQRFIPTQELVDGYRAGLAAAGLEGRDGWISQTLYGIEGGHAAAVPLLDDGVTGILCASDQMALGSIRAVKERGWSVPHDVSVVGFDDAGPNTYVDPALTSVQQPFEAMASAVVRVLIDRGEPPTAAQELRFRPELVVRASTGAAPGRSVPPAAVAGARDA